MNEEHRYSVVFTLREQLEKLNTKPDAESMMIIKKALENITDLKDMFKYFLVPSVVHLSNAKISKDVKLYIIDFMNFIIKRGRIQNLNLFINIYTSLLVEVYVDSKFTQVIEGHEELKENVMKCWITMLSKTSSDVLEQLYIRQYATKLAAGIHSCTLIAELEKSNSLRLIAVKCMMHLLQIHDNVDESDVVLRDQIADVVMLFLPGITSCLYKVATASEIQNHSITVIAIKALGRYLAFVMKDSPESSQVCIQCPEVDTSNITKILSKKENVKEHLEQCKRNSEWYKNVAEKLIVIFEKLKVLTHHIHEKVRKELVNFVNSILFSCTRNLRPCFENLFEILVILTEDESQEIVDATNEIINLLYQKSESQDIKSVLDICEENVYNLLMKLPRIMRTSGDSIQLTLLKELTGYLKILRQSRLSHILMSSAHSNKLIMSLAYTVELDSSNISLMSDITITEIDDKGNAKKCDWRQYKFIYDPSIEKKLRTVCHILGQSDCLQILIDIIFKFMTCLPQYQKELTLLLNWMLESSNGEMPISIYKQIIEQYTVPEYWYLPIVVTEETTFSKAQSNVVQCCLLTEGLGIIANRLKENYDQFLLKTLYIIIERAGHDNSCLSYSGRQCLNDVAMALNYKSVTDLLQTNIDYISYYVSVKLRRIEMNNNVLNVIKIVMEKSSIDFLPSLKSIIDNIFLNIKNKSKQQNVLLYLKVFYIFTISVKRMADNKDNDVTIEKSYTKDSVAARVIETLVDYAKVKKDSKNFENVASDEPIDEEEIKKGMENYNDNEDEEEETLKVPYYINLIENITKHSLHYLPLKEIEMSLLSISIINECLLILSKYENTVLPMVHQTWHPLVERFRNDNPLIINRAWNLLQTLTIVSKDFIRSRTLKDILPSIEQCLKKSAKKSLKKESKSFYEHTQIFKLQKNLLSELGNMCINLMLDEEQIWTVLSIVEPYLSSFQHPELQKCCVNLFKDIIQYNSDVVWVKCLDIWHRYIELVPKQNFTSWYSKIQDCNVQNEYVKNVKTVLLMT